MALTERPYRYSFSLNEIRYCWELADPERVGLYLQVRIMYAALGVTDPDAFTELEAFNLKPNTDGKIFFYLQAYIDSVLEFVLPDRTSVLTNANGQCVQYYVQFREVEDADTDNEYELGEQDHIRIAIKGGIEQHKHSRNNFFINYLDTEKPFLTWQPANRFIYPGEPFVLSFINKVDDTESGNAKVQVKTVYADGTYAYSYLTGLVNVFFVHVMPFNELAIPDITAANKIHYYEFLIIKEDLSAGIINPYRVYVHYRPVYEYYDLMFFNSIGGVSNLRVVADTDVSYDRSVVEAEKGIDLDAWEQTTKKHQRYQPGILLNRKYTGNIGLLNLQTQERREAIMDLLTSKQIYLVLEDMLVPVVNLKESFDIGTRKSLKDGFPIQFALSESNETFTPSSKTFGAGTHTETYP